MANFPAPPFVETHFPELTGPWMLGVAGWQWLAMGAALLLAFGLGFSLSRVFVFISKLLGDRRKTSWLISLGQAIQIPLTGLLALGGFDGAVHWIDLTGRVSLTVDTLSRQLFIAGLAWLIDVAAEMVAGRDGLGFAVMDSRNGLRTDLLIVQMIVIGLIGVTMDRVLMRLTRIPSVQWGYQR